jgi:hypothetical protein
MWKLTLGYRSLSTVKTWLLIPSLYVEVFFNKQWGHFMLCSRIGSTWIGLISYLCLKRLFGDFFRKKRPNFIKEKA